MVFARDSLVFHQALDILTLQVEIPGDFVEIKSAVGHRSSEAMRRGPI